VKAAFRRALALAVLLVATALHGQNAPAPLDGPDTRAEIQAVIDAIRDQYLEYVELGPAGQAVLQTRYFGPDGPDSLTQAEIEELRSIIRRMIAAKRITGAAGQAYLQTVDDYAAPRFKEALSARESAKEKDLARFKAQIGAEEAKTAAKPAALIEDFLVGYDAHEYLSIPGWPMYWFISSARLELSGRNAFQPYLVSILGIPFSASEYDTIGGRRRATATYFLWDASFTGGIRLQTKGPNNQLYWGTGGGILLCDETLSRLDPLTLERLDGRGGFSVSPMVESVLGFRSTLSRGLAWGMEIRSFVVPATSLTWGLGASASISLPFAKPIIGGYVKK
jgi:hypothetical protein